MSGHGAKPVALPSSINLRAFAAHSDEFILRLAKLIRSTAGLGSFLSTLSYSLYILTYLDTKSPIRAQAIAAISRLIGRAPKDVSVTLKATPTSPPVHPFAPYIGLINDTRFAIRLTSLLPLYMLLKSTIKSPPKDPVLRALAQAQVILYIVFTALENLWFLGTKNLLSPTLLNRLGGSTKLMLWSCRAWLVAILCDYGRLMRESQIAKEQRNARSEKALPPTAHEQAVATQKWYAEFLSATSYLPMAVHYSSTTGIGLNLGMIGLSGVLGGSATLTKLWAATKE